MSFDLWSAEEAKLTELHQQLNLARHHIEEWLLHNAHYAPWPAPKNDPEPPAAGALVPAGK